MSEYDDWKQENDRWEAYLYPNGVLRNKLGITKAAKWHKMERDFVAARNTALRPNTGLTTGNVGEELFAGTTSAYAENTLHWGRDRLPTGRFLASSRRTHSCVRCGFWGYPIALEDLIPDFI